MRRTSALLAVAFSTAMLAAPAFAADVPAANAKEVGAQLATAYFAATQVEREVADLKGKNLPDSLKSGLGVIEQAMAKAEPLSNGHEALTPGIRHVRANLKLITDAGKVTGQTATLVDEISIELYALLINADILQAVAHLNSAKDSLAAKRAQEVSFHLQEAGKALEEANNRGAYHIQNDIEEIQSALIDMVSQVGARVPLSADAIDERIAEVTEHLFDVGKEHM